MGYSMNISIFINILLYMDSHTFETIALVLVAIITAVIGPTILELVKVKLKRSSPKTQLKRKLNMG